MVNIYVLDKNDLSVYGVIHNYGSLSFTTNYSEVGDFILSIDNRLSNSALLIKDRVITLDTQGVFAGMITGVTVEVEDDGSEVRKIYGKSMGIILKNRVVNNNGSNEYSFSQGYASEVMKDYVNKNLVNATDSSRNVPHLVVGDNSNVGDQIRWQSKFDNLLDVVEEISSYQRLGWNVIVDVDRGLMTFDVFEGRDLSDEIIFSTEYGNIESQQYTHDEYEDKNFSYVAGEIYDLRVELDPETGEVIEPVTSIISETTGEEITIRKPRERRIYQIGDMSLSGLDRKEDYIEVSESEDEYIDIPELGRRRLDGLQEMESFEATVINTNLFSYGEDYNVGDIVSVYDTDWDEPKRMRVSSATIEINEGGDLVLRHTFGDILPTFLDKMDSSMKRFEPYTKK